MGNSCWRPETLLLAAVKAGNIAEVKTILKKFPGNVDGSLDTGFLNALGVAVEQRQIDMVEALLEFDVIDINYIMPNGETALTLALRNRDIIMIELLLANGAHPFTMTDKHIRPTYIMPLIVLVQEYTPEYHADFHKILDLMFQYDVSKDLARVNSDGLNCIDIARRQGKYDLIPILTNKGRKICSSF